jgi:hypothetical protein
MERDGNKSKQAAFSALISIEGQVNKGEDQEKDREEIGMRRKKGRLQAKISEEDTIVEGIVQLLPSDQRQGFKQEIQTIMKNAPALPDQKKRFSLKRLSLN